MNHPRRGDSCAHEVYIKGLCGNCGIRLDPPQSTSVSMIHSVPELKVSQKYAKEIGKADQERLIEDRKLVLLVDLDQTILHTTHEEIKNDPNVHTFTLWPGHAAYYTKLRPYLKEFLESMSKIYELHIFTFGCRRYAHQIASIIDPDQKYFGNRILSRDESVDQFSKKGNLNNLFPCGDAMVCIIDDRSDVWKDAGNLIQVKPYSYFKTSISDGVHKGTCVEDDESLERDVDKLEALLGLSDDGEAHDDEDANDESEDKVEPQAKDSTNSRFKERVTDANNENLKKKSKTSDSHSGSEYTSYLKNCDQNDQPNPAQEGFKEDDNKDEIKPNSGVETDRDNKELDTDEENEEFPSSPVEESDDHLLYLPTILERIHDKWYMELDERRQFLMDGENYKLPDIKDIIRRYLRKY